MTYINRTDAHAAVLDRPVWGALSTCLAPLSEKMGSARALRRGFGPLAAAASVDAFRDFMLLISHRRAPLVTLEADTPLDLRLCIPEELVPGVQMLAPVPERPRDTFRIEDLNDAHAAQMLDLAQRTKPGPFSALTHQLGDFIGIFEEGRLVAMAGQRLKLPGFTEISAVCVDPRCRGRGMGSELVRKMSERILDSGAVPFLHAYESNAAAVSLYEHLGFQKRARMQVISWIRNAAAQYG